MNIIQKVLKAEDQYYIIHLTIINPFLPERLSEKEILVLAAFMEIEGELVEDYRFNPLVRKKVMEKVELSPSGLSGYLKSLISKGMLIKNKFSGRISISSFLTPENNNQGYQFKITR